MAIKRRNIVPKQGATRRITSILILPRVIRKGNFRITTMVYAVYPKMKLTSTRQIRPCVGDMVGIVPTCLNML
jgi:hypothetical protein